MPFYEVKTQAGTFKLEVAKPFGSEEEAKAAFSSAFTPEGIPVREMRPYTGVTRSFDEPDFVGPPAPIEKAPEPTTLQRLAPTAVRVGGQVLAATAAATGIAATPVLGPAAPITGLGIAAGLGYSAEDLAQELEVKYGMRVEPNEAVKMLEAGLGLVPFTKAGTGIVRGAMKLAPQGAALAAVSAKGRKFLETGEFDLSLDRDEMLEIGGAAVFSGLIGGFQGHHAGREVARVAKEAAIKRAPVDSKDVVRLEDELREIDKGLTRLQMKAKAGQTAEGDRELATELLVRRNATQRELDEARHGRVITQEPVPDTANPDTVELAARQRRVEQLEQELGDVSAGPITKEGVDQERRLTQQLEVEKAQLSALRQRVGQPRPLLFGPDGKPIAETFDPLIERTASAHTMEILRDDLTSQGEDALRVLFQTEPGKKKKRLYLQILEAFEEGLIDAPEFARVVARHGWSVADFYRTMSAPGVRAGAQKMAHLSVMKRRWQRLAMRDKQLRDLMAANGDINEDSYFWKLWNWMGEVDAVRRVWMLGQVVTGIRNAATTAGRFGLDIFEQALRDVMPAAWGGGPGKGKMFASAWEHLASVGRSFKKGDTDRVVKLLDEADQSTLLRERLFATPAEADAIVGKVGKGLTWWTRAVENYYRRAKFTAALNSRLIKRGIDPAEAWRNPSMIRHDDLEGAVVDALEVTFQSTPKSPTGKEFLRYFQGMAPATTAIMPYPKYFGSAMKFFLDFNPLGFLKLMMMGKGKRATMGAETLSRAMLGTGMLAGATAIRMSPHAGERWYEIKGDDGNVRSMVGLLGPFLPMLFFGELMAQAAEHGADYTRYNISADDWLQGMIGVQRVPPGVNAVVDVFRASGGGDKMETFQRAAGRFMGEWIGGFTVPLRTLKDILTAAGAEGEGVFFDPREPIGDFRGTKFVSSLAAPTIQNVPFLGQAMDRPASVHITRGEPRTSVLKEDVGGQAFGVPLPFKLPGRFAGLMRQTGGMVERERNAAEIALDEIGMDYIDLSPRSGIPSVDRALSTRFGRVFDVVMTEFTAIPQYQKFTPEEKELWIRAISGRLHEIARQDLARTDPQLAAARKIKSRFGSAERRFLRSKGFDVDAIVQQLIREASRR